MKALQTELERLYAGIDFNAEAAAEAPVYSCDTCQDMGVIRYEVGINDPRYFSKCFKQRFNMTPTEYRDTYGKSCKL